jgi:hypothetical protein
MAMASRLADSRRRLRRITADQRPYCSTNGCPTHLVLDSRTGIATCPICGFVRRLS